MTTLRDLKENITALPDAVQYHMQVRSSRLTRKKTVVKAKKKRIEKKKKTYSLLRSLSADEKRELLKMLEGQDD